MEQPKYELTTFITPILLVVLAVIVYTNFLYLLKIPPVWPDEALFADAALNLLNRGWIGTGLLKGTLEGAEEFGFGYPPLYFYMTAIWFKIFGFTIFTQRLLSLFTGLAFLGIFGALALQLAGLKRKSAPVIQNRIIITTVILLLCDAAFLKATHIARPEIQVLLLGFISVYFYLKLSSLSQTGKSWLIYSLVSAVSLGLAFITHFLAVIFLLAIALHILIFERKRLFTGRFFLPAIGAFGVIIIAWLFSVNPNYGYFFNDITLRLRYKTDAPFWIWIVLSSGPLATKLLYILYFLTSWQLIIAASLSRNREMVLLVLIGLFSWVFTYLWQTEYSFIYVAVFSYTALGYLALQIRQDKNPLKALKLSTMILFACFLLLNIYIYLNTLIVSYQDGEAYQRYSDELTSAIPEGTTIYMSAIPDPYYAFKNKRQNILYEYPALPTEKSALLKILNQSDYIIINNSLERVVAGDVVVPYISNNAEEIKSVGTGDYYQANVIKLKPRNSRK